MNGVQISEVPKFLTETLSEITHAIKLVNPFDAIHPLIIPLQLSGVTSYFDVYSLSVAGYENNEVPKIHLTAEEPYWDPSMNEYSEIETCMVDHQGQINISTTAARDQYSSAQMSHNPCLMMPLMLWIRTILQLHLNPRS